MTSTFQNLFTSENLKDNFYANIDTIHIITFEIIEVNSFILTVKVLFYYCTQNTILTRFVNYA